MSEDRTEKNKMEQTLTNFFFFKIINSIKKMYDIGIIYIHAMLL